jgi:prevent-host-death family protein
MATPVPQRDLRNRTAELLRRVENGERLQITVHGHPVAELGPLETADAFVGRDEVVRDSAGSCSATTAWRRNCARTIGSPRTRS